LIYCNFRAIGRFCRFPRDREFVETISAAALSGHDSQTIPRRDRGRIGGGFAGGSGDGLLFPRVGVQRGVSATAHREPQRIQSACLNANIASNNSGSSHGASTGCSRK